VMVAVVFVMLRAEELIAQSVPGEPPSRFPSSTMAVKTPPTSAMNIA